jgi:hypothetical protein
MICASARQFDDWSADYRLFSQGRFDPDVIFGVVRRSVGEHLAPGAPFEAAIDDTGLSKTGTKIPGVSYRRDPMSPPFHPNFIRAQRMLQISACLPSGHGACHARTVPIDFVHAPTAKKPRKPGPEQQREYNEAKKELNLSRQAATRIIKLREKMDSDVSNQNRELWVSGDGSYTNGNVMKRLPDRAVFIGRIRGDAKLYHPPAPINQKTTGRKASYGERAPTPEEIRKNEGVEWQTATVWAAGKVHQTRIKVVGPLMWRSAGANIKMNLIVIAPLGYRPRKGSRILYRQPAYIVCTDTRAPTEKVLQAYFRRWGVEVNFRDEKQIIGIGETQVRSDSSVELVPPFFVAVYAMLLLAGFRAFLNKSTPESIPSPKWRRKHNKIIPSTQDYVSTLRYEMWGELIEKKSFSGFAKLDQHDAKPQNYMPQLAPALLYAVK